MSRPDWREVTLRRAHARAVRVRTRQRYPDMGRIQIVVGEGFLAQLAKAAAMRDMNVTAYCRRAVAAFVAADTRIAFETLLQDTPHPDGRAAGVYDPGTGHGQWVASRFADDTDVI